MNPPHCSSPTVTEAMNGNWLVVAFAPPTIFAFLLEASVETARARTIKNNATKDFIVVL